ncbi:hypothetical protein JHN59_02805 [Streptomyces sp. MBT49]|uniref:hypothetical protein n=1 Tax=Streptomyces sp. MBT49 TaxID=1488380 RepID=UPI00190BEB57|nr:hypothetical protein [Streptomyces sp. MBT49]MBK3623782.1 hypothetical protein [Streptomyces sp. MBT49]
MWTTGWRPELLTGGIGQERAREAHGEVVRPRPLPRRVVGERPLDAVLSGLGARRRKDAGVAARLTRTVLSALEAADLRAMEAELARSATDWTVVWPPRLQDKPVADTATVKQGVGVAY